jgi:hypothetical protein
MVLRRDRKRSTSSSRLFRTGIFFVCPWTPEPQERLVNPYIRGWINYYSHFYKSAMHDSLRRIDFHLRKWARRKFKRFKQKPKSAREWLAHIIETSPELFAHWPLLHANRRILGARQPLPRPAVNVGLLFGAPSMFGSLRVRVLSQPDGGEG